MKPDHTDRNTLFYYWDESLTLIILHYDPNLKTFSALVQFLQVSSCCITFALHWAVKRQDERGRREERRSGSKRKKGNSKGALMPVRYV